MKSILLLASTAVAAACMSPPASAQARSDNPWFCATYQKQWSELAKASVTAMSTFLEAPANADMRKMCPDVVKAVSLGVATRKQEEQTEENRLIKAKADADAIQANAVKADKDRVQKELFAAQQTINAEKQKRVDAEARADKERTAREALEIQSKLPGAQRGLLACSESQDILKLDQGNIPNVKFENLVFPPENLVVYDLADIAEGAVNVYSFDTASRQWKRSRSGARQAGDVITVGDTSENDKNLRVRESTDIDLKAMTSRGMGYVEPISLNGGSALSIQNGKANLNLGAMMQRGPRLWLELRGRCAFQFGDPPTPLTPSPEFHVTSRDIPKLPKPN